MYILNYEIYNIKYIIEKLILLDEVTLDESNLSIASVNYFKLYFENVKIINCILIHMKY